MPEIDRDLEFDAAKGLDDPSMATMGDGSSVASPKSYGTDNHSEQPCGPTQTISLPPIMSRVCLCDANMAPSYSGPIISKPENDEETGSRCVSTSADGTV